MKNTVRVVVFMMTMMKGRHSLSLSPSSERKIPGGRGKEGGSDLPLNPLSHPIRGGFLSGGDDDDDEMSTSCAAVNSIPLARARARHNMPGRQAGRLPDFL